MIEITLVVSPALFQQYPHSELAIQANYILRDSFLRRNLTNQSISYPPLRVFAALLALGANWTRYLCYRELGRQYTFQVAIIKDHKLITTGPYSEFDRAPPFLCSGIPQVHIQLHVARFPRSMAVGEQVLRNKDILALPRSVASDVLLVRSDNHDATAEGG